MPNPHAPDLLRGAGEIAEFIYGRDTPANRRRIYNLGKTSKVPLIKLGGNVAAKRSSLDRFFAAQESGKGA